MLKKISLLIVCFFSLCLAFGQKEKEINITGKALFAANETIRIIGFNDYYNFEPKTLCNSKIDNNGYYSLRFKSNKIELIQIAIRNAKAELFVVPGRDYSLNIDMNLSDFQQFDPDQFNSFLQITSLDSDTNDLNLKINRFNNFYADLLDKYIYNITYLNSITDFDTFKTQITSLFPLQYNPTNFYESYKYYTFGEIESYVYAKSSKKMYEKYFDNDYILYNNPAYMALFSEFYNNYLLNSPRISKSDLNNFINITPNYLSLFNAVGNDYMLINQRLRELVILTNLGEMLDNEDFDRGNVLELLNYISKNTHFPEHNVIIENIINRNTKFKSGTEIPKVTFKTPSGADFKLNKLSDKYVYIQIFSTQCLDCIREMILIKEMKEMYEEKVEFVSISVDFDENAFLQFKINYPEFDWTFLHFNNQYEWLSALEINSLPEYLWLTPDGKIGNRFPPEPVKNLSGFLHQQFFKEPERSINPMFPR